MGASQHLNMVAFRPLKVVGCPLHLPTFTKATFHLGLYFYESLNPGDINLRLTLFVDTYPAFFGPKISFKKYCTPGVSR
jgi:hypothetical protein